MEAKLKMENVRNRSGSTDIIITIRIQELKERISGVKDNIEEINITVKENSNCKKLLTQSIQEIQDTVK